MLTSSITSSHAFSTERANEGARLNLFVRERRGAPNGPAVLFVQGRSAAAMPAFDLDYRDYSWMAYLADAGFHVFAMDLQGYGRSSKLAVMDDACNTSAENQSKYLIPKPLEAPCPPSYPHAFGSFASDWDEIDTVVEFIRSVRGGRSLKIDLVGWSRGGMRAIGYAALRPDNVERIVAFAPTRFPPVARQPTYPMQMRDKRDFFSDWDRQIDAGQVSATGRPLDSRGIMDGDDGPGRARTWLGSVWRSALSRVHRSGMDVRPSGPRSCTDAHRSWCAGRPGARARLEEYLL